MYRLIVLMFCAAAALAPSIAEEVGEPGRSTHDLEQEAFLSTADVMKVEEIGKGITKPKRLTLAQGGKLLRASFKTVNETTNELSRNRSFEQEFSDRFVYEVAAYRIDRLLGMDLVPVAVIREIDGVQGVVQLWIEDAVDMQHLLELGQAAKALRQFEVEQNWMQILDALIYNTDRNPTNILVLKNGQGMYLIDHSRSFRLNARLPAWTAKGFEGQPEDAVQRLQAVDEARLLGELEELLGRRRALAVEKRRRKLVKLLGG